MLDEVQQYIGENTERSIAVQELQEQCCSRLGANVLFVATGQNALSATSLLQRLQGRFPVTVELQDTDVEQVTREVVLKKKPSAEPRLRSLLEAHSGEIERHLASSKIAFNARDRSLLVQDYPLLPARRRFWERVLRAVDKAGTGAQLRSQLWIVHDAVEKTADLGLGNVVSAAFIYDHIKSRVLQSGVLLQEIAETIAKQTQEEDGDQRFMLCALIFLIGQLPRVGPSDAGVHASAETLADLMVTDLNVEQHRASQEGARAPGKAGRRRDRPPRRQRISHADPRRAASGTRLFKRRCRNCKMTRASWPANARRSCKTACSEALKKRKLIHGESKEARSFELHFGSEPPRRPEPTCPIWIRDGWEVEEKTVLSRSPRRWATRLAVVYGFMPRQRRRGAQSCHRQLCRCPRHDSRQGNPEHARGHRSQAGDGDTALHGGADPQ